MTRKIQTERGGASWPTTFASAIEVVVAGAAAAFFIWNIGRFFPNSHGRLGYDYGLFVPWMLAGFFWQTNNGILVPPENLPSFCGGVPFLFNPQSIFYSVPQLFIAFVEPVQSLFLSWVLFGLLGGLCMYFLLRQVFKVSVAAALVGATIFLLNGFYTSRMIIGHVTFHGFMLLPAIALAIFMPPPTPVETGSSRLRIRIAIRSVVTGLLVAYLFYSGATNVIIPMALAIVIMAVIVGYIGRWSGYIAAIGALGCALGIALCAYKLLPSLAFAANVIRPVSLRMSGDLPGLIGGAAVSLFAPQILSHLDPGRIVLDRVELEYGVGIVPLLVILAAGWTAIGRNGLRAPAGPFGRRKPRLVLLAAGLLVVPILVNYDALGLRWLMLHIPIIKSMSVMLRFWSVYIPVLCVLTSLLLDYLIANPVSRIGWSAAAITLTIVQSSATDMRYYNEQMYDPAPVTEAYEKIRKGEPVPTIVRIADPWSDTAQTVTHYSSRNDALVGGVSDFPCYEPMFGYKLEVFRRGRLAPGPALEVRDGRLNLKNPVCYVFPAANNCQPGDEFTTAQLPLATAFVAYRSYPYTWPVWQRVASGISLVAGGGCLVVLVLAGPYLCFGFYQRSRH